jgi:hypothetical protein
MASLWRLQVEANLSRDNLQAAWMEVGLKQVHTYHSGLSHSHTLVWRMRGAEKWKPRYFSSLALLFSKTIQTGVSFKQI